jgi:N-acetylneuraminic acid mutarotase
VYATAAVHNGYLYVVGGSAYGQGVFSTVYVSKLNADGSLGNWATTTPFNAGRDYHVGTVLNGYLYVGLGADGANILNDIQHAKLNPDGTISPGGWSQTAVLPSGRRAAAFVQDNGHVYLFGGCGDVDCNSTPTDVLSAPINANGTVGEWKQTTALPSGTVYSSMSSTDEHAYSVGGCADRNCTNVFNEVRYVSLVTDGGTGDWVASKALPETRSHHGTTINNGFIYAIGGQIVRDGDGTADALFSHLLPDGSVEQWKTTSSLLKKRMSLAVATYNNYVYAVGGYNKIDGYLDGVEFAKINFDGALGPWSIASAFSGPRPDLEVAVHDGYLFLIGGGDNAVGYKADVQVSKINPDGSLEPWQQVGTLPSAVTSHVSAAANGFLFVLGGTRGDPTYFDQTLVSHYSANGVLDGWSTTSSFSGSRMAHAGFYRNGNLYVAGGTTSSSGFSDVQFAPVTAYSVSTKSTFSKQFDLGSVQEVHSIEIKGTLGGVNSGFDVSYRIAGDDAVYGAWSGVESVTVVPGAVDVGDLPGRYIEVSVTINDNGRLGVTSGMGSSGVSELSISYGEEQDGGTDAGVDSGSDTSTPSDTSYDTGADAGADGGTRDEGTTDDGAWDAGERDTGERDDGGDADAGVGDSGFDVSHPSDVSDTSYPSDASYDTAHDAETKRQGEAETEDIPQNMYSCSCSTLALGPDTPWVEPAKEDKKQALSIAVFQFEAMGADKKIPTILTDTVLSMLNRLPDTRVIGSKEIDAMLNYEQKKQMTGCNDTSCAVALGGALGVDKILMGSVGKLGETHILDMKLLDIRTAHIDSSYNKRLESGREEEFLDVLPEALTVLFPWAEGTWAKTTVASQKPRAAGHKPPANTSPPVPLSHAERGNDERFGRGHAGQFGLSLRGIADLKFTGGAGDLSAGYAFTDWLDVSLGLGYGAHAMLKPRLSFFLFNLDGSVKPYVTAHGLVFFSDPIAYGAGGGPGIQYDLDETWGLFLELPFEYFFSSPEIADAWVILVALGVQLRI